MSWVSLKQLADDYNKHSRGNGTIQEYIAARANCMDEVGNIVPRLDVLLKEWVAAYLAYKDCENDVQALTGNKPGIIGVLQALRAGTFVFLKTQQASERLERANKQLIKAITGLELE